MGTNNGKRMFKGNHGPTLTKEMTREKELQNFDVVN